MEKNCHKIRPLAEHIVICMSKTRNFSKTPRFTYQNWLEVWWACLVSSVGPLSWASPGEPVSPAINRPDLGKVLPHTIVPQIAKMTS